MPLLTAAFLEYPDGFADCLATAGRILMILNSFKTELPGKEHL